MSRIDRRDFLKGSAVAAAGMAGVGAFSTAALARPKPAQANDVVNVAVVGVRGRGRGLASGFASMDDVRVVALADVDESVIDPAAAEVEGAQAVRPRAVGDFRTLLDDPEIHALVIATPDHWHAPATILACQAGKDVYVEKPASHNVREGRLMVEAARKYGRVVQHGTQSRSAAHCQSAVQALREGIIGDVLMAKAWNNQRRANIGHAEDQPSPPPGVNYDLWLGPAPERPFNANRFHYNWHWFWDYGTGDIGNDGVHQVDVARWGLVVEEPVAVSCGGGKYFFDDDQQTPDTQVVLFEFPETTLMYEMRLWAPYHMDGASNANAFYGTEGYMILTGGGWRAYGPDNQPIREEGPSDRDGAHRRNFIDCIKSRSPERLNAEIREGHLSAQLCHLGNIAYRVGRRIRFDAETGTIPDDSEANALLRREYRAGFEVPDEV